MAQSRDGMCLSSSSPAQGPATSKMPAPPCHPSHPAVEMVEASDLVTNSQPLFLLPTCGPRDLCLSSLMGRVGGARWAGCSAGFSA